MADVKKFLDQSGVSTLWSRITEKVVEVDEKAKQNAADIEVLEGKVEVLEKGTYDDTAVRELIAGNIAAITVLNGGAEEVGSVAYTASAVAATKVAEIVANADADFHTLKEIADWILNDTTGAADMANDIAALEAKMDGVESTVVAHISSAIQDALTLDGADKFALASNLIDLAGRVELLENAGYMNEVAVNAAIDSKITALKLAENYEAKGAAAAALTAAKAYSDANLVSAQAYADAEIAKIQALTEEEIDAAIAQ